jgi:hypothetical protein
VRLSEAEAIAYAREKLPIDLFGQVRIEEQHQEVSFYDEGRPVMEWEEVRYRHVEKDSDGEWERADV